MVWYGIFDYGKVDYGMVWSASIEFSMEIADKSLRDRPSSNPNVWIIDLVFPLQKYLAFCLLRL